MEERSDPSDPPGYRIGRRMILLAWIFILGLATLLFDDFLDQRRNPNQDVASESDLHGVRSLTLQANRAGQYLVNGRINGREVEFIIDTGATLVVVPAALAEFLNLRKGPTLMSETANGVVRVYATRIDSLELGRAGGDAIALDGIEASINPGLGMNSVLLGMSFLRRLEFSQRGDLLILTQR